MGSVTDPLPSWSLNHVLSEGCCVSIEGDRHDRMELRRMRAPFHRGSSSTRMPMNKIAREGEHIVGQVSHLTEVHAASATSSLAHDVFKLCLNARSLELLATDMPRRFSIVPTLPSVPQEVFRAVRILRQCVAVDC